MENNLIPPQNLPPFLKFCYTIGILPTSYRITYTYEEQVLECIRFIKEEIIPTVNDNALATKELQEKFVELVNYVETYLENLDVQSEINTKLDEMVESGELEEIIAQYLNAKSITAFNTKEEMKSAENLIAGSLCMIYGNDSINDGGNAYYMVREIINTDIVDNTHIIALLDENLVAELINPNEINPENYTGTNDTEKLQNAINYACEFINNSIPATIKLNRLFTIDDTLLINYTNTRVPLTFYSEGNGGIINQTTLLFDTENSYISDLHFDKICFKGTNDDGNLIIQSPKFINVTFNKCTFKDIDKCVESDSYIQAFKFMNCLITGGHDNFIKCNGCYDVEINSCTIEARQGFVLYQTETSGTYNRIFYLNVVNNLIEGITNSSSGVFRLCRITKANICNNYFESNYRNILIDCYSPGGELVIENNRAFFGATVQANNGLVYVNPANSNFSIPRTIIKNNIVENAYLVYFDNTSVSINTLNNDAVELTDFNNHVANTYTTSDYKMAGKNTNLHYNVLPIIETDVENLLYTRFQVLNCDKLLEIIKTHTVDGIAHTLYIKLLNKVFHVYSQSTRALTASKSNQDIYFGIEVFPDDEIGVHPNNATSTLYTCFRGGSKFVRGVMSNDSSENVIVTATLVTIGTRQI